MARQTRADRRARRQAREQQGIAPPRRPDGRATPNGDSGEPERRPTPAAEAHPHREHRGLPGTRFVRESWGELQKVEWPNQNQLVQGTVVVLVACIIVGFYLWGADQAFRRLVQQVFLGQ